MQFLELVKKRYSVRGYKPDMVEDNKLKTVLEAMQFAPSASNRQPVQFIIINTQGKKQELRKIYDRDWFINAPLLICACGLPHESWVRSDGTNYTFVDVAIAMDHLILAATEVGLGTCWVAAFNAQELRKFLGLPEEVIPVAMTPLGYPDIEPTPKERKPLDELVRYDHW